ncbi:winged helix-turn-helix domain-containing tetratricopeptide repeat protein [Lysobacter niastensis]|uniref:Winged helix-turn-helix domain-containing protein n=1 Tax=Lysobacter niastensis TaxID=380629 RepID=A0ABS0B6F6_9GAMM|nr:winged helix-turn-helix domain-containing tetratricopeptide repeat protein [Lysobacter niastensis]MBF6024590.1 winged helix-turn-helix domain-containing protein [Lysobacter niastensis]
MTHPQPSYAFDRFRLRTAQHELLCDGQPVSLEPKAFALLTELLARRGELLGRDDLLDAVWGHRYVTPGVLSRSIAQLRRALGDDSDHPRYIQTVHALGYRFIAPVTCAGDGHAMDAVPREAPVTPQAGADATNESSVSPGDGLTVPIAVLPFANMSGDPEQVYFSDGITEDIITELSRWRILAVRSRAASFRYRGVAADMRQVARELHVRYILEGSVRRMGDRMRITAQLVDAQDGKHVWAEKFDRDVADVFAVQDEVVRTIVGTLVGRVQAVGAEQARRKPPASLAAYECVLKGNALPWAEPWGAEEATRMFERAIALDPGYGFAHSLLAAMRYGAWYEAPIGDDAALQESYALATRALELDPDESTCHSIYAQLCHLRQEYELSLQHVRRAVELNPNNQWNAGDMGMMLNYAGEPEEALQWFRRARELDPYFDVPWYWREYGLAYLLLHRYDEALAMLDRITGRNYRYSALRAASYALRGDDEIARIHAADCLAQRPEFTIAHYLAKTPFKRHQDSDLLAEGLRRAGLPD